MHRFEQPVGKQYSYGRGKIPIFEYNIKITYKKSLKSVIYKMTKLPDLLSSFSLSLDLIQYKLLANIM